MCGLQGVLEKELGDLVATKGTGKKDSTLVVRYPMRFHCCSSGVREDIVMFYLVCVVVMMGFCVLEQQNRGIGGKEEEEKRICKKRMMRCGRDEINT